MLLGGATAVTALARYSGSAGPRLNRPSVAPNSWGRSLLPGTWYCVYSRTRPCRTVQQIASLRIRSVTPAAWSGVTLAACTISGSSRCGSSRASWPSPWTPARESFLAPIAELSEGSFAARRFPSQQTLPRGAGRARAERRSASFKSRSARRRKPRTMFSSPATSISCIPRQERTCYRRSTPSRGC